MKIVFSHIGKTAGTSVRINIGRFFDPRRTLKVYEVGGDMTPAEFLVQPLPKDWGFLSGHLSVEQFLAHPDLREDDEEIILLSFVRQPVDRLISVFNYMSTQKNHPLYDKLQGVDPFGFMKGIQANLQSNMLKPPQGSTLRWHPVIAPVEHMTMACAYAVSLATGQLVPPQEFEKRFNVTADPGRDKAKLDKKNVPETFTKAMQDRHAADFALYTASRQHGWLTGFDWS